MFSLDQGTRFFCKKCQSLTSGIILSNHPDGACSSAARYSTAITVTRKHQERNGLMGAFPAIDARRPFCRQHCESRQPELNSIKKTSFAGVPSEGLFHFYNHAHSRSSKRRDAPDTEHRVSHVCIDAAKYIRVRRFIYRLRRVPIQTPPIGSPRDQCVRIVSRISETLC